MAGLVIVTEDEAFASAVQALASDELALSCVHVEEAVAIVRRDRPDILAVDTDSVRESHALIGALSLLMPACVVALAHQAWPGSRASSEWRKAGADTVLAKPSGRASPTLAGFDKDAYARWLITLANRSRRETHKPS
jgi:chemotaxis response regulator CheB